MFTSMVDLQVVVKIWSIIENILLHDEMGYMRIIS